MPCTTQSLLQSLLFAVQSGHDHVIQTEHTIPTQTEHTIPTQQHCI